MDKLLGSLKAVVAGGVVGVGSGTVGDQDAKHALLYAVVAAVLVYLTPNKAKA